MVKIKKVRIPTKKEWLALIAVTDGSDDILHWGNVDSWCQDTDPKNPGCRIIAGREQHDSFGSENVWSRFDDLGFRPAFEVENPDVLGPDGTIVAVGTLLSGGLSTQVPADPTWDGDIPNYVPGTALRFVSPVKDTAYQVQAIKVGNILIADRVLMLRISWLDIARNFGGDDSETAICRGSMLDGLLDECTDCFGPASSADEYGKGYRAGILHVAEMLGFQKR